MNLKGLEALDTWRREEVNPDKENCVSTRRKAEKSRVCLHRGRGRGQGQEGSECCEGDRENEVVQSD